uniref:Uncharacterized protein n=1 Tax=Leersia perrieri TaxID=77586 RepID=A0A0D9WIS8_9ORYZ
MQVGRCRGRTQTAAAWGISRRRRCGASAAGWRRSSRRGTSCGCGSTSTGSGCAGCARRRSRSGRSVSRRSPWTAPSTRTPPSASASTPPSASTPSCRWRAPCATSPARAARTAAPPATRSSPPPAALAARVPPWHAPPAAPSRMSNDCPRMRMYIHVHVNRAVYVRAHSHACVL